jgi:two-component system LytT family response regulator
MLNALIIDDEENGSVSLSLLIQKFAPGVRVVATATDPVKGVELISDFRPDIVFLDINMPILDGFGVLDKVAFKKFHLIFTTAHEEYALRAIKKSAVDYLLKPIGKDELLKAIQKVENKIRENESTPDVLSLLKDMQETHPQKIAIPTKTGIDLVPADKVMYIEANSNNAIVTFANGDQISTSKSLKEFESNLSDNNNFIRLQNSFIINVQCVARYSKEDGGYAIMQNKKSIPVSKQKKEEFLKRINLRLE